MNQRIKEKIARLFEKREAIIKGHFVGTSGRHLDTYIAKEKVMIHPRDVRYLAKCIVLNLNHAEEVDVVCGPAIFGSIIASYVANQISKICGKDAIAILADRGENGLYLKRGFGEIVDGKNVLIVDDVLDTGKSASECVDCVRNSGGKIVGVSAFVNRGQLLPADLLLRDGEEMSALWSPRLNTYRFPCPQCEERVPINTDYGHGAEFLDSIPGKEIYG